MAAVTRLVGAVGIKVRPVADGFRREADRLIKRESAGLNADIELKPVLEPGSKDKIKTETKEVVEKAEEAGPIELSVNLSDKNSLMAAIERIKREIQALGEDKIPLEVDEEGLVRQLGDMRKALKDSTVEIGFNTDEQGLRNVIARAKAMKREVEQDHIEVQFGDDLDSKIAEWEAKLKALEGKKAKVKTVITYDRDRASLEAAIAKTEARLRELRAVKVPIDWDDKADVDRWNKELKKRLANYPLKLKVRNDQDSWDKVISDLKARRADLEKKATFVMTPDEAKTVKGVNKAIERARAEAAAAPVHVDITYRENTDSLDKAIAEVKARLAAMQGKSFTIDADLNEAGLRAKLAELENKRAHIPVEVDYQENRAGLEALKGRIEAELGRFRNAHITLELDEAGLRRQLAETNVMIAAATHRQTIEARLRLNEGDLLKVWAQIKLLTKNQTVTIFTKLNNAGILLAAAKLTGLRAASRWSQELAQSLGTLDRNLPIVAGATMLFGQLGAGITTLVADAFSLGNGLGEVIRGMGLLGPSLLLGLGSVMLVLKGTFKDFGAALNGDDKALKKLSQSGKDAVAALRPAMMQMREVISKGFWDEASGPIQRFSKQVMPDLADSMNATAGAVARNFGQIMDAFGRWNKSNGLQTFYTNLTKGLDAMAPGMGKLMDAFLKLSTVGSQFFPMMGRGWDNMMTRFNAWVDRISADGTLVKWINQGIQGLKDLFSAAGSLVKIWANIGHAAEAAGALTLHSFAGMLAGLEQATRGARFQENLTTIFKGAVQASEVFHRALANMGPSMDQFSVTIAHTFAGAASAIGAFAADIGDVMANPKLTRGIDAFTTGLVRMFVGLRPAMDSVVTIIATFQQVLGQVATDAGPLFANLFEQLANVLTAAWSALQPFLPNLMEIGSVVINQLGPALSQVATAVIPAFARVIEVAGNAIQPVIQFVADLAVGFANFATSLSMPDLAALVGFILSLNTAFKAAAVIVPIAVGAMEAFNVASKITAISTSLLIPGLGLLLAALSALAFGAITSLATSQQKATPYATEYADALTKDAEAAGNAADAIGEATTKLALQKLVNSGAYQSAQNLGIGYDKVTEAVLHGGDAYAEIEKKASDANDALRQYDSDMAQGIPTYGQSRDQLKANADEFNNLKKQVEDNRGSIQAAMESNKIYASVAKAAGLETDVQATKTKALSTAALDNSVALQTAAAATRTLTDAFAAPTAKIDAMRKTFDLLVGPDAKQQVAEATGAYVKGFNDLKDSAASVAPEIQQLGKAAYGPDGFLNVAKGNAAVLQVNQALKSEVDNVWAGAKAAYDAAIQQGKSATDAFKSAQDFVNAHKQDYMDLATASGLSAKDVMGQWDAVFGHDWVLKVSYSGLTETATAVQQMLGFLHVNFDGKKFMAYMEANPDQAMLAIQDPVKAATNFVDKEWKAKLDAMPQPALDALTGVMQKVDKDWTTNTGFQATLDVAKQIPGLAEAIARLMAGKGPYDAYFYAALDPASVAGVEAALRAIAAQQHVATISVQYVETGTMPGTAGGGVVHVGNNGGLWGMASNFPLGVRHFANGGFFNENHVAQIARSRPGQVRVWAEAETGAEAYIPYALTKRSRSTQILSKVAGDFGYDLVRKYNNGGVTAGASNSTSYHAPVNIGTLITTDPDAAVHALETKRRDSMAAHNIRPF